jgi:hypothetical protein
MVLMASGQDRNEANAQAVMSVLALKKTIVNFPGVAVVQVRASTASTDNHPQQRVAS